MALICDICKSRPAQARVTFMHNGSHRAIDVCGQDYLQLQSNPQFAGMLPPENSNVTGPNSSQSDISELFSDLTHQTFQRAAEIASKQGIVKVLPEQVLMALTEIPLIQSIFSHFKIKSEDVRLYLEHNSESEHKTGKVTGLSPELQVLIERAGTISSEFKHEYIGPEHLLAAMIHDSGRVGSLLVKLGLTEQSLRQAILTIIKTGVKEGAVEESSSTPELDKYIRDLSVMAKSNTLDPVIGREEEVASVIEILARRTKNNPILLGEPGVGKTAIVEGLAQKIEHKQVPEVLHGKRVVELNLSSVVAGTKYRGDFEDRLKKIIDEIVVEKDSLLVFIDEIHTVVGTGSAEGGLDTANAIKPAMARGDLHLIGATTYSEYQKYIEKDSALERRFQPVKVDEPSIEDTVAILSGLKDRYEAHHNVEITDIAVQSAVNLSNRYITHRFLPDKAIDLIDQSASRAHIAGKKQINDADIAEVVAKLTGIPVTELSVEERERLLHLEDKLHERVVGQEEAINAVAKAIRIARSGLSDAHSPIATLLFLGPTGVGKTELTKALAETVFGTEQAMTRIDMSEFMERHSVSKLIGSPPGYVGYEEGGKLTEAVRRKPYQVLLLDEIEKAHPDIYNVLLQLFDEGRLTDGKGRLVDFSNTIIIATSNLGSELYQGKQGIGFSSNGSEQHIQQNSRLLDSVRGHFRSEFINRIDEIAIFNQLSEAEIKQIVKMQLAKLKEKVSAQNLNITFSSRLIDYLAKEGYAPEFGARELKRKIKSEIENPLAVRILENNITSNTLRISYSQKNGISIS